VWPCGTVWQATPSAAGATPPAEAKPKTAAEAPDAATAAAAGAAAPFEGSHGHTGTVPPGGQAAAAAATSGDVVFNTSKPIWETVGHTAPRADRPEWKKLLAALPSVKERERDAELDGRILRGHEIVVANLEQLKPVVRFLVSSTFTVSRPCVCGCALCFGLR
jgi:hypothetical protein